MNKKWQHYQIMNKMTLLIIKISRPKFWLYLAGPFLLGYTLQLTNLVSEPNSSVLFKFLFGFLYFLIPANFFLYGINDYYDTDTDQYNPKKGSKENKLISQNEIKPFLIISILLSFVYLLTLNNSVSIILMLLFIFLSYIYSAPPIRLKSRPFLDSSSNILYVLPGLIALNEASGILLPWHILIGFFCWTFAMHLFSAIPDIEADSKANLKTTAIFLGFKNSLLLCFFMWTIFSLALIQSFGYLLAPTIIYPLIPIALLINKKLNINKIYWLFPYINGFIGFLGFLLLVIPPRYQ